MAQLTLTSHLYLLTVFSLTFLIYLSTPPSLTKAMMHELISHPGLQFYIFQLSGTLTYTLTVNGKPPKAFELQDADFEDAESLVKEEESLSIHGTDASAVGLKLKLVKNVGLLEMRFEGCNGGSAIWRFEGLEELGRMGKMYATAETQTLVRGMVDSGIQTGVTMQISLGVQTVPTATSHANTQTDTSVRTKRPSLMTDASTATNISLHTRANVRYEYPYKKRSQMTLSDSRPVKKLKSLESTDDSKVAKMANNERYLFLWGNKLEPRPSKHYGALRIDTVNMEVIWKERSGEYPWKWEKWECHIDLREPKLKVEVVDAPDYGPPGLQSATMYLQITYPSGLRNSKRLTVRFLPQPEMFISGDPDGAKKTKISDLSKIISAIEDCISHQSGMRLQSRHSGGSGVSTELGSIVKAES